MPQQRMTDPRRPHRGHALRRMRDGRRLLPAVLLAALACTPSAPARSESPADLVAAIERGVHGPLEGRISYYARKFAGRPTASGEIFDPEAMTMAHPTLPFGTLVRVTTLHGGRSVVLKVNDRGPFHGRRVADVSPAAARLLGMIRAGLVKARIEVIDPLLSPVAGFHPEPSHRPR